MFKYNYLLLNNNNFKKMHDLIDNQTYNTLFMFIVLYSSKKCNLKLISSC